MILIWFILSYFEQIEFKGNAYPFSENYQYW
jgi:hypothetical protein